MGARRPNYRLVKIHRPYLVEEVARLLNVHRHTVRNWLKRGLPASDSKRPTLILGRDLHNFLKGRRDASKRPCRAGEIYCMRCRLPRRPAGGMADYKQMKGSLGNLIGICPVCDAMMFRRVNPSKLADAAGNLEIASPTAQSHITPTDDSSVNVD